MSTAKGICSTIGFVLAVSGSVRAQTAPSIRLSQDAGATHAVPPVPADGPPLSLDDAIRESLAGNADLTAARRQVDPLRERPAVARALPPPMFEAQIWQWPINSFSPGNVNMYMFTASQDLPGRGKRETRASLAEADVRVAESEIAAQERQVIAAVTDAYWRLSIARQAIRIHLASVDLMHELADAAQAKYAAGRMTQQDVLKAVLASSRLHDDLIGFELQADQAKARLNALRNRPLDTPIGGLDGPSETTLAAPVSDLEALALREQPALHTVKAQVDQADAQRKVATSTGTPDWSIAGGYMLQPHQTDGVLATVSMTWPRAPWSRRAVDARIAEAAATMGAVKAQATAMETQVRLSVRDAYLRVKAAEARAALLRTTLLPQAKQAFDVSRLAYETDRADFLALIDGEHSLLDVQLDYERALADWRQALADLEHAIGGAIPAEMLRRATALEVQR